MARAQRALRLSRLCRARAALSPQARLQSHPSDALGLSAMREESIVAMTPPRAAAASSHTRAVAAVSIGNMLEWYDFTVYALLAGYIAGNFFVSDAPSVNLVKAFLAFGLGFVVRPLGALFIGNYGDRGGRKAALTLTILLMALGTGTIALAPTYAAIGVGAPLLLLLGRVLQGFSAGGEVGTATAYLLESATEERRGIVSSWLEASMGISNILGALAA